MNLLMYTKEMLSARIKLKNRQADSEAPRAGRLRRLAARPGLGRYAILGALLCGGLFWGGLRAGAVQEGVEPVWLLEAKGPVSPAMSDYIVNNLAAANAQGAELFVIQLDTPGGLDQSMRTINKAILASEVPVVTWVAPSGSRAASAGTYMLYASHIAAMAPATNLGAATPVNLGGAPAGPKPADPKPADPKVDDAKPDDTASAMADDPKAAGAVAKKALLEKMSTLERKMTQDAVAYIRGLAQLRGRNVEWAQAAVVEARSLPAEDALAANVIDFIAADVDTLMTLVDGREVRWDQQGNTRLVQLSSRQVKRITPTWRDQFLAFISNPNFAFILLSLGAWALVIELYNPGVGLPLVVGLISLAFGLYGLHMLPVNAAGLALLLLGMALMVAEVFVSSFGVFGIGGAIAFFTGAIFLLDTNQPEFQISIALITGMTLMTAAIFIGIGWLAIRAMRNKTITGASSMLNAAVRVLADFDAAGVGKVSAFGENWQAAVSPISPPPKQGETLYVANADSVILELSRAVSDPEDQTDSQIVR